MGFGPWEGRKPAEALRRELSNRSLAQGTRHLEALNFHPGSSKAGKWAIEVQVMILVDIWAKF